MWSLTGADATTELTLTDNQDLTNFKVNDKVDKGTVATVSPSSNKMGVQMESGVWRDWAQSSGGGGNRVKAAYGNGIWVCVSMNNYQPIYSTDGINWYQGNSSDLRGWNSVAAEDYSIYATPTMFILDRNRKILSRPVTLYDLRTALERLSNR